jgi:hypothetical protein
LADPQGEATSAPPPPLQRLSTERKWSPRSKWRNVDHFFLRSVGLDVWLYYSLLCFLVIDFTPYLLGWKGNEVKLNL